MDDFALKPPAHRANAFNEAAARMGLSSIIIEKDFWVVWTLKRLFSHAEISSNLIFKGGTSLSKGFGLIHRFSEDIDLSIDRKTLGFGEENDPANKKLSGKKREKLLKELRNAAEAYVQNTIKPKLHDEIEAHLGDAFSLEVDAQDSQSLLFQYPQSLISEGGCVRLY